MAKQVETLNKGKKGPKNDNKFEAVIETPIIGRYDMWDRWDVLLEGNILNGEAIIRALVPKAGLPDGLYTISLLGDITIKEGSRLRISLVHESEFDRFAIKVRASKLSDGGYQFKKYD